MYDHLGVKEERSILAIYSLVNTEESYFPRLGDFGRGVLFFER